MTDRESFFPAPPTDITHPPLSEDDETGNEYMPPPPPLSVGDQQPGRPESELPPPPENEYEIPQNEDSSFDTSSLQSGSTNFCKSSVGTPSIRNESVIIEEDSLGLVRSVNSHSYPISAQLEEMARETHERLYNITSRIENDSKKLFEKFDHVERSVGLVQGDVDHLFLKSAIVDETKARNDVKAFAQQHKMNNTRKPKSNPDMKIQRIQQERVQMQTNFLAYGADLPREVFGPLEIVKSTGVTRMPPLDYAALDEIGHGVKLEADDFGINYSGGMSSGGTIRRRKTQDGDHGGTPMQKTATIRRRKSTAKTRVATNTNGKYVSNSSQETFGSKASFSSNTSGNSGSAAGSNRNLMEESLGKNSSPNLAGQPIPPPPAQSSAAPPPPPPPPPALPQYTAGPQSLPPPLQDSADPPPPPPPPPLSAFSGNLSDDLPPPL